MSSLRTSDFSGLGAGGECELVRYPAAEGCVRTVLAAALDMPVERRRAAHPEYGAESGGTAVSRKTVSGER